MPETLQTAYGSLTTGLDLSAGADPARPRRHLLGGTCRSHRRQGPRRDRARHHPPGRPGPVPAATTESTTSSSTTDTSPTRSTTLLGGGVDAALELVGTPTLPDTLRATRIHGTVCFTGMLSNQWTVPDFYPIDYIPTGVRLTAYGGGSADLPPEVLQSYLDRLADGPPASARSGCTDSRTSARPTSTSSTTAPSASTSSSPSPEPGRGDPAPDAGARSPAAPRSASRTPRNVPVRP